MSALDTARGAWPDFGLADDIRPALRQARAAGETAALVTLYAADGGAPRGLGAQMLVTPSAVTGYLSGGCVEADLVLHALETIETGAPKRLAYGRGGPIDIRLPCGGRIEVLIEAIPPDDAAIAHLLACEDARRTALLFSDGITRSCVEAGRAVQAGVQDDLVFRRYDPAPRLIVLGCDPTALALCTLAQHSIGHVALVRPNGPEEKPPVDVRYLRERPAPALSAIGMDARTAIVVALHDELNDHEALLHALPSAAGYVGLLGSARRLPQKIERLRMAGIGEHDLARLKAPIGLRLGGKSPWDVATAILGEVIQTFAAGAELRLCPADQSRAA